MKPAIIAGNWKSNKTIAETKQWLTQLASYKQQLQALSDVQLILCAPYTALYILQEEVQFFGLPILTGAQDLSPFVDGAYTGAVSARMVRELVQYVIIGHSERRKYFAETDEMLQKKVDQAKSVGLHVIYCVPDGETKVATGSDIVAYEPVWAIGTGKTDTPENANSVISTIKQKSGLQKALYGGSIVPDNVVSFLSQPEIDGVLLGGASLDPGKFFDLISKVSSA